MECGEIEAAGIMIAMNKYTASHARTIVASEIGAARQHATALLAELRAAT